MKSITRQTLQSEGLNSYVLYLAYCKSERERVRGEQGVGARAEEKPSGDEESNLILTLTYHYMTCNATLSYTMRCETH